MRSANLLFSHPRKVSILKLIIGNAKEKIKRMKQEKNDESKVSWKIGDTQYTL